MGQVRFERLTGVQFEQLCGRLLQAEGFVLVEEARLRGLDFLATRGDRPGRWSIECKSTVGERKLRDVILRLSASQQLFEAQHALLITSSRVSRSLREEVGEPLGVEIWDRDTLLARLDAHPELLEELARSLGALAERQEGETRLRALHLSNFRGIRAMRIELGEHRTTVLVGFNGAGKSTILDALARLLSWPARRIFDPRANGMSLGQDDIHNEASESEIALDAVLDGVAVAWKLRTSRSPGRAAPAAQSELRDLAKAVTPIQTALAAEPDAPVPLFVYYPVNRAVLDIPRRIRKKHTFTQRTAHEDALVGGQRDFRLFFEWFRQREDIENERQSRGETYHDPQIDAVRRAVYTLMPGLSDLRIQRNPMRMLVRKDGHDLIVDQLSDGEKCLLALVGDLARRLALANPGRKDPLVGNGVVLIDELDLHLHPKWQRRAIPDLQRTFPNCQLIVSTHSPQVIGNVGKGAVKLLEDCVLVGEVPHTRGRDATSILSDVMDLPVHPPDVAAKLSEIGRLIDEENLDEARKELDALAEDLGEQDVEIVRHRALIEFLD